MFVCFIVFLQRIDNKNGETGTSARSAFEFFSQLQFFVKWNVFDCSMQMKVLLLVVVVAVVIETTSACVCNNRPGGCVLERAASPGQACKCVPKGFGFVCLGFQVGCRDPNHYLCRNPDTSKAACIFATGQCGGY